MAEHPDIQVHINVDERSAAFFALGLAKALKEPVGFFVRPERRRRIIILPSLRPFIHGCH